MREPLQLLIDAMPSHDSGQPPLDIIDGDKVRILPLPPDGYVWPDLTLDPDSGELPSPIVLVTAPGAMGKSAAAKAIAASIQMPYVDLARVRVGSGSLTGELAKAIGFKAMGQFVEDLKAGKAALVLDSNDEAQLAAGRENYLAFLNDLAWLLVDAVPAAQVVLLGRRDATETTMLALMDLGLTPPLYQVAPLTHTQASELIGVTLDRKPVQNGFYSIHRQHPVPFAALRDSLFKDLSRALEPKAFDDNDYWDAVAPFLGYPPVVVALAERLAVDNPAASVAGLTGIERSDQPVLRGVLLQGVLDQILDRETAKVQDRLGESLAMHPGSPERSILYGRDEQAARLLDLTGTVGIHLDQPAALLDTERAKYEELIESFVLDHPFIHAGAFANVVFSDYIRAWAISSSISGLYAVSRSEFFSSLPKPGPFFTHFLHALSLDDGLGTVPEDVVDDAIHSFALGTYAGMGAYVHRSDTAVLLLHDEPTRAELAQEDPPDHALAFRVSELSGVLALTSPVARLLCVTEHSLLLKGVEGNFDLGPDVSLVAGAIELDARNFTAFGDGRGRSGRWNLVSAHEMKHSADLRVAAIPTNALTIMWPDPWHQWKPYAAEIGTGQRVVPPNVRAQILLCIRRVLISFHASVKDDPSVSADKVDRILVGTNPVFVSTLFALQGLGLIGRYGNLYRINLDAMAEYEISWVTLRGDDPIQSLRKLFLAVIERPELAEYMNPADG